MTQQVLRENDEYSMDEATEAAGDDAFDEDTDEPKRYPIRETPIMHAAARALVGGLNGLARLEQEIESGDFAHAAQSNRDVRDAVQRAIQFLIVGGARASDRLPPTPQREMRDTPATRALVQILEGAVEAAEIVDAERGQVMPDDYTLKPGEPRGTGWAETINELAIRLRAEVEGGSGARGDAGSSDAHPPPVLSLSVQ